MKFKYEDWIIHCFLLSIYIIIWGTMLIKVHNPKDYAKKKSYSRSLSFRFYLTGVFVLGLIYALVRDFIKLYNNEY